MIVNQRGHEVVCFAGDSGDGIQLAGSRFASNASVFGNDVVTLPDYPAEIRAPAGTVSGVSAFQLQFSSGEIHTAGDAFGVLVAMNAAALKSKVVDLISGGLILADLDGFTKKNITLAGYSSDPLSDGSLSEFRLIADNFTKLTVQSLNELDLPSKQLKQSKNFFVLGIVLWVYSRSLNETEEWLNDTFSSRPAVLEANTLALQAGYNYADTTEIFSDTYQIQAAPQKEGLYRNISGNEALSLGFVCAAEKLERPLFLGSYPITPASEILHTLSNYQDLGVKTFQAEDEIAAACAALGASYAGALGITTTSGPGLCLKAETLNLAVMAELPLVVINVQRGGPSTGLPTKTEQSDLLFAMYGRNGDSPIPVLAAASSADCFDMALEASRIATTFMTPVILLSDGYLANGTESWKVPNLEDIALSPIHSSRKGGKEEPYFPYERDSMTRSREWVTPGTKGKIHRIGGLEKQSVTGEPSHDPENHQKMTNERAEKIAGISEFMPKQSITGACDDQLLVISWGSTFGSVTSSVKQLREKGKSVAHVHLRFIYPFPVNLASIIAEFNHILVFELNDKQLVKLIRSEFAVPAQSATQVTGLPFKVKDVSERITQYIEDNIL
ncbi:2-oxoacid:acceptor oxidoreductase subunit alpha [Vibrio amylolyticus]|uniref:2-oxoacid:acceptor oxidoreductase subunit alpha n=1 Tax=Vibrio amylolyticus TaxID=2847292 RepID=UPI003550211C